MPVGINGVHAVGAMQVAAGAEHVELRAVVVTRAPRQPFIALLHFLQEADVGIDRVQCQPQVVDARALSQAHHALVDVVGRHAQLHRRHYA